MGNICDTNERVQRSNEYMLRNIDKVENVQVYDGIRHVPKYSRNAIKQKLKWEFNNKADDRYITQEDWGIMRHAHRSK